MTLGAIGGVLLAAGVVDAGVGLYESSQAHKIASSELGMQQTIFGEQQGFEQQLANLINDPSSVSSLPGYQFQFDQGADAVAREMAASGFLGSGNEAAALTQFGQGTADSFYMQQAQLLAQLSGITNASSPTQAGTAATTAQNNNFNQLSSVLASLGATGKLLSSAGTPGATAAAGGGATVASGGGGGLGAIWAGG